MRASIILWVGLCLGFLPASVPLAFAADPDPGAAIPIVSCGNGVPGGINCIPSKNDLKEARNAYARGLKLQESNRLAFRSRRETGQRPELIPVDDDSILYYADPLDRLRRMHTSFSEMMTGVSYQAPWPNPTQRFW